MHRMIHKALKSSAFTTAKLTKLKFKQWEEYKRKGEKKFKKKRQNYKISDTIPKAKSVIHRLKNLLAEVDCSTTIRV